MRIERLAAWGFLALIWGWAGLAEARIKLITLPVRERVARWAGLEAEAFGIVFLEAAACGLPLVAGSSGGVDEVVTRDRGVVLEQPTDTPAVASAALQMLRSEGVSTAGTETWATVAARFKRVLLP